MCAKCPHQVQCQNSSPKRKDLVTFSEVEFNVVPEKLGELIDIEEDLDRLYDLTYLMVFDRPAKDRISRVLNYNTRYNEICDQLGCSRQLFMLAVMSSACAADKEQDFWANMLYGPSAIMRYEHHKELCRIKFGQFDLTSIQLTRPSASRGRFLNCEQIFGDFIIDMVINKEGDVPFLGLYKFRELAFDPLWLAIEDSYLNTILKPHVTGEMEKTEETSKFRSDVAHARRTLLKHKVQALTVFTLRSLVLKDATSLVLRRYHLNENDFLFERQFTSASQYWVRLGLAVRRMELLRLIGYA